MEIAPRDVNYFLAVVQHGRLAPAAEACNVTQPALTKAIRRLETECGLTLFERSTTGMLLTAEGVRFREVAEALSRSYENAMRVAADVRAQQACLLRVGCTDTTRASLVPATLATLLRQRPGLRASLQIGRSDQLARAVRLDIAVIPTYGEAPAGCDCIEVGEDSHLPVMSAQHPLAQRRQIMPRYLAAYGWVAAGKDSASLQSIDALFMRFQLPPPIVAVEIEYMTEAVLALVRASELLAMVPRSIYRDTDQLGLQLISIPGFRLERSVCCITRSGAEPSALKTAFCELIAMQTQLWQLRNEIAA